MACYLVESYLPRASAGEPARTADRARRAAAELREEGSGVQYVSSYFLSDDETCFHLFHGESVDAVRRASARASIASHRITEVMESDLGPAAQA